MATNANEREVKRLRARIAALRRQHKIELDYLRKVIGIWQDRYCAATDRAAKKGAKKR